ncbi:cation diffusion facilitator family transporter [Polycladospora coralii]|nr:cation diffusion facilitator family transporter [Polycladospora coralii]
MQSRKAQNAVKLNIVIYIMLALSKCIAGFMTASQIITADGLNNVTDVFLSCAILVGIRVATQPADHNHAFGHKKAEAIAVLVAASFMGLMAIEIWIGAIVSLLQPSPVFIQPSVILLSLVSAVVMGLLSAYNQRLSRKIDNHALYAAAQDNRSDAYVSLGAALGVVGVVWGLPWLDGVIAVVIGGLILKTSWEVGYPAIHILMDGFEKEKLDQIKDRIKTIAGIEQVMELRARCHGKHTFLEVTISVNAELSVHESHILTEKIEKDLIGYENIAHIHIHVEPHYTLKNFQSVHHSL